MKFSIEDFFSKSDQIRNLLRIWSHLLKKSSMENFILCAMYLANFNVKLRRAIFAVGISIGVSITKTFFYMLTDFILLN